MTRTISQRQLRNDTARVIEAVAAGETFVVTRNGDPVAELRPVRTGRRVSVSRDEVAALARAGLRIDRHEFRADLDRLIEQGP
jgi:prevent-host-death family protein